MKRALIAALAVVLCLAITACTRGDTGAEDWDINEKPADMTEGPAEFMDWESFDMEGSAAAAHIAVDAEIIIYMDETGTIEKIKGYNDAGIAVADKVSVEGADFVSGTKQILIEARTQGIVTDDTYLYIDIAHKPGPASDIDWMMLCDNIQQDLFTENDFNWSGNEYGSTELE